jgi:hypothetical protein
MDILSNNTVKMLIILDLFWLMVATQRFLLTIFVIWPVHNILKYNKYLPHDKSKCICMCKASIQRILKVIERKVNVVFIDVTKRTVENLTND